MDITEGLPRTENELDQLRAIVDGGEARAREVVTILFGLFESSAARSGHVDLNQLIEFLDAEYGSVSDAEDRTAMLVRQAAGILAFHRDDRGTADILARGPPVPSAAERADVLRRAEADAWFDEMTERDPWEPGILPVAVVRPSGPVIERV